MINGDDVMPCVPDKTGKGNARTFPMFRGVVEHTPGVACVVCLPREVVGVAIRILLTLKLDRLGSIRVL